MMTTSVVQLYWIPLGAGASVVRTNGILYEAVAAAIDRRPRCGLFHSALEILLPEGRFMVEMTPAPDRNGALRGVVATGPVGLRSLGRFRPFQYEVRRWREGIVPDLQYAVASPVPLTGDPAVARRVFDALAEVPRLVWGRDQSHVGEMWSCNSITSWALTSAGIDTSGIPLPEHGRAPGWHAGAVVATRRISGSGHRSPRVGDVSFVGAGKGVGRGTASSCREDLRPCCPAPRGRTVWHAHERRPHWHRDARQEPLHATPGRR